MNDDEYFAIAPPGLEPLVAAEVGALGAQPRVVPGGVEFTGDARVLYAANLHLRVASRVLVRVARFRARTFFELERHAKKIPWSRFLMRDGAVALRVTSRKSKLYHEGAIAERLTIALENSVGAVQQRIPKEDDDDAAFPDGQLFVVRFLRDECVISADASGALLHMRGYRQAIAKAPLRETLAAALIMAPRWSAASPLLDPLCGSGTIPIEAALLARNIPPGLSNAHQAPRAYAFEKWPDHDEGVWSDVIARARAAILPAVGVAIIGSDRDAGAITAATANAQRAGVSQDVVFEQHALSAARVPGADTWIVTNPPYGVRVGSGDQRDLYAALGRLAREQLPDGRVVLLTPDPAAERSSGLPLATMFETRNGGIPVRLAATPAHAR